MAVGQNRWDRRSQGGTYHSGTGTGNQDILGDQRQECRRWEWGIWTLQYNNSLHGTRPWDVLVRELRSRTLGYTWYSCLGAANRYGRCMSLKEKIEKTLIFKGTVGSLEITEEIRLGESFSRSNTCCHSHVAVVGTKLMSLS